MTLFGEILLDNNTCRVFLIHSLQNKFLISAFILKMYVQKYFHFGFHKRIYEKDQHTWVRFYMISYSSFHQQGKSMESPVQFPVFFIWKSLWVLQKAHIKIVARAIYTYPFFSYTYTLLFCRKVRLLWLLFSSAN